VPLGHDDLGGQVLGRPAQRVGLVHNDLGKTKVHHDAVSVGIDQRVLRFHVTVAYVPRVHVAQRFQDARAVELGGLVVQTVLLLRVDDVEQLPPLDERQEQVQVLLILEAPDQGQDEGVLDGCHDLLFAEDTLYHLRVEELTLVYRLQRVRILRIPGSG
jgi:hypothetical protein